MYPDTTLGFLGFQLHGESIQSLFKRGLDHLARCRWFFCQICVFSAGESSRPKGTPRRHQVDILQHHLGRKPKVKASPEKKKKKKHLLSMHPLSR